MDTDPNTWVRHTYGLENVMCSSNEDTVVITGKRGQGNKEDVLGTIPAAVCTVENVFCWALRRPAPRADSSDTSRAQDGRAETLDGVPNSGRTDPIITRVDEGNFVYRNETEVGHIFHDGNQVLGCADLSNYPNRTDIPARCSYVERQVTEGANGVIKISTHGAGYNPIGEVYDIETDSYRFYDFSDLNEVGGVEIFSGVDQWIQEQLINHGTCPSGP